MTLRPLVGWPHPETVNRGRSPFSATWSATLELLDRELFHLKDGNWSGNAPSVLQIALREQDFRNDGMPRANAIPTFPGVILNIESSKGPLSYPCDKFTRWQDNLRAVALGLEALRKISRYGITPGDEQYAGWRAIPEKASGLSFTAESALEFLRTAAGSDADPTLRIGTAVQLYRRARAAAHPDRNGGDRSKWDQVEAAAAVLRNSGQLP